MIIILSSPSILHHTPTSNWIVKFRSKQGLISWLLLSTWKKNVTLHSGVTLSISHDVQQWSFFWRILAYLVGGYKPPKPFTNIKCQIQVGKHFQFSVGGQKKNMRKHRVLRPPRETMKYNNCISGLRVMLLKSVGGWGISKINIQEPGQIFSVPTMKKQRTDWCV